MIYRHVWDNMQRNQVDPGNGKVIFAGFNALTLVEEHIIKWVIEKKGGRIFWDVDAHYFDDPVHEAGHFLRKYFQDTVFRSSFPAVFPNRFRNDDKTVQVISSSQFTGQVKIAGNLVNELSDAGDNDFPENTVVVLPDESLLSLLLYAIPDRIGKFNITMGYPVSWSHF